MRIYTVVSARDVSELEKKINEKYLDSKLIGGVVYAEGLYRQAVLIEDNKRKSESGSRKKR